MSALCQKQTSQWVVSCPLYPQKQTLMAQLACLFGVINRHRMAEPPSARLPYAQLRAGSGVVATNRRADGFGTLRISIAATTHSAPAAKNAGR